MTTHIMNEPRGTLVVVKAFDGELVTLRLWEIEGEKAFVSSEAEYQKLLSGDMTALNPVGVPLSDVVSWSADKRPPT